MVRIRYTCNHVGRSPLAETLIGFICQNFQVIAIHFILNLFPILKTANSRCHMLLDTIGRLVYCSTSYYEVFLMEFFCAFLIGILFAKKFYVKIDSNVSTNINSPVTSNYSTELKTEMQAGDQSRGEGAAGCAACGEGLGRLLFSLLLWPRLAQPGWTLRTVVAARLWWLVPDCPHPSPGSKGCVAFMGCRAV